MSNREKGSRTPYLGTTVSGRLWFQGGDDELVKAKALPKLRTLSDIANYSRISEEEITWLSYENPVSSIDHYSRFEIPKRSGGKRLISAPKPKLRKAQSWIDEMILQKLTPSEYCYAFRPKRSIVDNARKHSNKKTVIKMDLKDFFPSITYPRVRGFFESVGYNPGVSSVLALLCTDAPRVRVSKEGMSAIVATGERGLPQGACTSPALSNLIASRLDKRIEGMLRAIDQDWTYTRYADDLAFSTNLESAEAGRVIKAVQTIAKDEGFEVNQSKTRVMNSPRRQIVTGLIVNSGVKIPKATIKKIRALFHNIETLGAEVVSAKMSNNATEVAKGYLSFMYMVDKDLAKKYAAKHRWLED